MGEPRDTSSSEWAFGHSDVKVADVVVERGLKGLDLGLPDTHLARADGLDQNFYGTGRLCPPSGSTAGLNWWWARITGPPPCSPCALPGWIA